MQRDNLLDAVSAIQLSRKVITRGKAEHILGFAYNAVLVPLAGRDAVSLLWDNIRPEFAGMAMTLSSVTVVTLSLLLKRYVPPARLMEISTTNIQPRRQGMMIHSDPYTPARNQGSEDDLVEVATKRKWLCAAVSVTTHLHITIVILRTTPSTWDRTNRKN